MGTALAVAVALAGGAIAVACQPTLDDTISLVSKTTVLAVRSNPAEAPEGTPVTYTALVVDGHGPVTSAPIQWDYCGARNPLSNLGPVATACVQPNSGALTPIGRGVEAKGPATTIPDIACANFGPRPPPAQDGGADGGIGRPVDPDTTGGYYQPVSLFLPETGEAPEVTLYRMRVKCVFSGATEAVGAALAAQYHLNVNPEVESLKANGAVLLPDATGKTNSVRAGQKLTFEVTWPECPVDDKCGDGVCGANESAVMEADAGAGTASSFCPSDCASAPTCSTFLPGPDAGAIDCVPPIYASGVGVSCPHNCEGLVGGCPAGCETAPGCPADCKAPLGCAGAERYVNLDLTTQTVVYQREGIDVAWFATGGSFDNDSTGRGGADDATTSDNGWTAPIATGPVHVWVVLSDDRHGVGWAGYALDVTK
jgi:hypothetical protein